MLSHTELTSKQPSTRLFRGRIDDGRNQRIAAMALRFQGLIAQGGVDHGFSLPL